jgi:VIT1/CCC1 family predicted Fe2+/Mn2+ transporter
LKFSYIFPVSLGFTDGIITALMISSYLILNDLHMSLVLALRISTGSAAVGTFSYFIASYANNMAELSRISRHINPSRPNRKISVSLLSEAYRDSITGTIVSGACSFLGSMIPLGAYSISSSSLIVITVTEGTLAFLGYALSRSLKGSSISWIGGMFAFGVVVILIGLYVRIIV